MTRVCSDCPATLGARNKSGRCRSCVMKRLRADPAMEAKRAASFRHTMATNPEVRARHCARSAARLETWRRTPEGAAFIRANSVKASAASNTPESRAKRAASIRRSMTGWCPDDRRAEYLDLRRYHGAAEAKRIILADLARIEARRLAALTWEERMAEKLAAGATVTERRAMPSREHAFSLTGSGLA